MGLTLVQPDVSAPAHFRVEYPFNDEQRALDAPDFTQRHGKIVLARIGGELAQQLARSDGPGDHGGGASQYVRPVRRDQLAARLAADQCA